MKWDKRWSCVVGCVLSRLLSRLSNSEEMEPGYDENLRSFVAPSLHPTPDDNVPVEVGWAFNSTGEMSIQYAGIGTIFTSDSPPIPAAQNLVILRNPSTTKQCLGFHPSWSQKYAPSLLHPSRSLSRDLRRTRAPHFICVPRPRPRSSLLALLCQTPSLFLSTLPPGSTLDATRETVCPTPSYLEAAAGMPDTVENPSRGIFHPQRTDPSVINTSPPPIAILYDGRHVADVLVTGSVSNIRSFMHSSSHIAAARNLRGEEAQVLIDLIDQVSDTWFRRNDARGTEHGMQALTLSELDGNLRRQCLHLLYKICKTCELLPASYVLRQELMYVGNVRCCGGFADVSEGEYLGRRVAIKHLRFGTEDALNKVFKVFKS